MHVKLHKIMFIILPEKGYLNKDEILMKLARLKWNIRTYLKGRLACNWIYKYHKHKSIYEALNHLQIPRTRLLTTLYKKEIHTM